MAAVGFGIGASASVGVGRPRRAGLTAPWTDDPARAAGYDRAMSPAPGFTREQRAALEALKALSDAGEAGGAIVLRTPEAPDSPMLNRVVGLGVDAPATESDVDAALDALGDGVSFYLTVAPGAEPPELVQWLRARGLESGWGWMQFHRDVSPPAAAPAATSLR